MKKEIKNRLFTLMHRRGGVYEITDGYHYQSLLTSDEKTADDYLDYLCDNNNINSDIVAFCIRDEIESLILQGKAIPPEYALFAAAYSK